MSAPTNAPPAPTPLRIAVLGTGFWARYQIAAWRELAGVEIVALYNRTKSRAEALARDFGIQNVYDDAEALLEHEHLDAVDIITDVNTHARFVHLAAARGVAAICQKPMAPNLETAQSMLEACQRTNVPLIIHENFRWQTPIRHAKRILESGRIGAPFRARLMFNSSFPVFQNQPFLADLEQFILTDVGSHALDIARFMFGEAQSVYCQTNSITPGIKGEDVATVMLEQGGVTTSVELSYASNLERQRFPETFTVIEGSEGTLEIAPDYWVRTTTKDGTHAVRVPPPRYAWADPAYDLVHASIVPCNADILRDLRGGPRAETRAEDNIETVRLVFASYESARTGQVVRLGGGA
jgi:D-apiose dehydrogenase